MKIKEFTNQNPLDPDDYMETEVDETSFDHSVVQLARAFMTPAHPDWVLFLRIINTIKNGEDPDRFLRIAHYRKVLAGVFVDLINIVDNDNAILQRLRHLHSV